MLGGFEMRKTMEHIPSLPLHVGYDMMINLLEFE
jgi:hypothetical protein